MDKTSVESVLIIGTKVKKNALLNSFTGNEFCPMLSSLLSLHACFLRFNMAITHKVMATVLDKVTGVMRCPGIS
jgi:hypothetical protein